MIGHARPRSAMLGNVRPAYVRLRRVMPD